MKKFGILLALSCLSFYAFSQDLGKNIDYQYQRDDKLYAAYSLYANSGAAAHTMNLILVSNGIQKELKTIHIKAQNNTIKIPFKVANFKIESDDQTVKQLGLSADFTKLTKDDHGCDLKIVFTYSDKTQLELPFNYCTLKAYF